MMIEEILDKQRAFYESGNTLDTRSRRAMLQILGNTVKERAGSDPGASVILDAIALVRKHLYKWTGTGRLRLLMSLFAIPGKDGPIPCGCSLIDASGAGDSLPAILLPLVSALAAGNTAVVIVPDSPAGNAASLIIDDTFTDDFVAAVPAGDVTAEELEKLDFSLVHVCGGGQPGTGLEGFLAFSALPDASPE